MESKGFFRRWSLVARRSVVVASKAGILFDFGVILPPSGGLFIDSRRARDLRYLVEPARLDVFLFDGEKDP